jgi:transposase InsO family protein
MPWRETSPMEQRAAFVRDYVTDLFTITELAAQYGISRKTAYKWLERYDTDGFEGLRDRSRRPHTSPQATDRALADMLVRLRRRHPRWGATKLLTVAGWQQPEVDWPSRSTVCTLLKARGMVKPPRRRPAPLPSARPPLAALTHPNAVWTTDFKGEFRTGDGRYCYPLTLRDGFSRFVLRCDALLDRGIEATRRRFARAFADYGLPERIRSDNGSPFASPGLGGLSQLAVWWIRLGITPERIAPGHPEQNGSHEQFHSVLKGATSRPPATTAAAQQKRFVRFCAEYNEDRPHEALHNDTPASRYTPSRRPLPTRVPPIDYPGHWEARFVGSDGCVSWRSHRVFVATPLAGEYVAFEEIDDGIWTLRFATVALARYDERHRVLHPIPFAVKGARSASYAASARDRKNSEHE